MTKSTIIDSCTHQPCWRLMCQVGEWEPDENGWRALFENPRNGRTFYNYKESNELYIVHGVKMVNQRPCKSCAAWVDVEIGSTTVCSRGGSMTSIVCAQCGATLDVVASLPQFLRRPEVTFPRGARKSKNEHYTKRD